MIKAIAIITIIFCLTFAGIYFWVDSTGIFAEFVKDAFLKKDDFKSQLDLMDSYESRYPNAFWVHEAKAKILMRMRSKSSIDKAIAETYLMQKLDSHSAQPYILRSRIHFKNSNNFQAMQELDAAEKVDHLNSEIYTERAKIYSSKDNWPSAVRELEKAKVLGSKKASGEYLAKSYSKAGMWKENIETLEETYRGPFRKKDADFYIQHAKALEHLGDDREARKELDEAEKIFPSNFRIFWQRAAFDRSANDLKGTIGNYLKALELARREKSTNDAKSKDYNNRNLYDLHVIVGGLLFLDGKNSEASENLISALSFRPLCVEDIATAAVQINERASAVEKEKMFERLEAVIAEKITGDADAYAGRGRVREIRNHLKGSLADYRDAFTLEPYSPKYALKAHVVAAKISKAEAKDTDAFLFETVDDAIARKPTHDMYYSRAKLEEELGDVVNAKRDYSLSLRRSAKRPIKAYGNLVLLLRKTGDKDAASKIHKEAEKFFEDKINETPSEETIFIRGEFYDRIGDYRLAAKDFVLAADRAVNSIPYCLKAAESLQQVGRYDDSRKYLERVLKVRDYDHDALLGLSRISKSKSDFKKALEQVNSAVIQAPLNPDCYSERATILKKLNRPLEAQADELRVKLLTVDTMK